MPEFLPPDYGAGSLADVLPSVLGVFGVPGHTDVLGLGEFAAAAVLLVDGLGWELLAEHRAAAPFLAERLATGRALTAGFPSTTATSVAALGTGRPPGEHGVVGYSFATPHGLLNALTWRTHGTADPVDLRAEFVPETAQPADTALQRAAAAGVRTSVAAPGFQRRSGLTRAVLRGAEFHGTRALGDLAGAVVHALADGPALCYAYHGDLDLLGHVHGPGSEPWRMQLRMVDRLVESITAALPAGAALFVVADHGMVPVTDPVDADTTPELLDGVRLLGGEVRVRQVYAEPGAEADVLAAWRGVLGARSLVVGKEEAIAAGWFGPSVGDLARARIGDVLAVQRGTHGVVRSVAEPMESSLIGHHGSLTPAEQLVPLLRFGLA
jgi:type I phosphodiesterase/nucleotide pyrophosphatase